MYVYVYICMYMYMYIYIYTHESAHLMIKNKKGTLNIFLNLVIIKLKKIRGKQNLYHLSENA